MIFEKTDTVSSQFATTKTKIKASSVHAAYSILNTKSILLSFKRAINTLP